MTARINGFGNEKIEYLIEQLKTKEKWSLKAFQSKTGGEFVIDFDGLKLWLGPDGKWWLTV